METFSPGCDLKKLQENRIYKKSRATIARSETVVAECGRGFMRALKGSLAVVNVVKLKELGNAK